MNRARRTPLLALLLALAAGLSACAGAPVATAPTVAPLATTAPSSDLSGIKEYLLGQTAALVDATSDMQAFSDRYYELAQEAGFDYGVLWASNQAEVVDALEQARAAWMAASPSYEKMEGIVAGTPSLAQFDVDLDAGAAAADDPEGAVSFDLTLPDGRVLAKPGNLFGLTESALWGTAPEFTAQGVEADWNGDGTVGFGEALPDANMLKGGVDLLAAQANELRAAAEAWTPSESDAFTALVTMVPTMSEYFGSWKDSRFVAGEASTQRDFVAISRLADIQDILGGLELVYAEVRPRVESVDAAQAAQIATGLSELKTFVAGVYAEEQGGRRFTAEEADLLGAEAQNRATAITGQIAQVAGALGVTIAE
jgi:type IV pilus biogenesis protein CpaD/CtpE